MMHRQPQKKRKNSLNPAILFVITQGEWGGAQRYVFDLATACAGHYRVCVAVGEPQGPRDLQNQLFHWNQEQTSAPVTVIQLEHLRRSISPLHDPLAVLELRSLYAQGAFDLVHLNSSKAGIVGSIATRRARRFPRVVYTVHGWVFLEHLGWLRKVLYRALEKITARKKDAVIVLSEQDAAVGKEIMPHSLLHIVPLAVDPPTFLSTRDARAALHEHCTELNTTRPWIGCIANFYPTKNIPLLVESFARVRKECSDVQLVLIGDGPERRAIESAVRAFDLNHSVCLLGHIDAAAQYLPAFDVFALSSTKEGLPYALLETIHAGVPIVAPRVGGIPSLIVPNKTGLLVEPGNADSFSTALLWALTHPADMQRMATAARKGPNTMARMHQQVARLYSTLLSSQ